MVVILLGPPGVGKGTQAARLADAEGWQHVSTGDLLRAARREGTELGQKAQAFMDAGELVPDSLILDLVRDHLKGMAPEAGILLDGFPRTTAQADGLGGVLTEVGRQVDRVVLFEAPDETLVERLSGRRTCPECKAGYHVRFDPPKKDGVCDKCGAGLVQRDDDRPDAIRQRLETFHDQTAPLVDYYEKKGLLARVDGEGPMEEVAGRIRAALESST